VGYPLKKLDWICESGATLTQRATTRSRLILFVFVENLDTGATAAQGIAGIAAGISIYNIFIGCRLC